MAKILLLNGSAHQNGCTAAALQEMISVFEKENVETELIQIGNKQIRGCIGCMAFMIKAFDMAKSTMGLPEMEREFFTSFPDGK